MNAEELIITQYELVTKRGQHQKLARENYQKCLMVSKQNSTCLENLMDKLQETDKRLDPEQFDSAVKENCCEYCQAGWLNSKAIKDIKKRLKGLKLSMHALARQLLKRSQPSN